MGFSKSSLTLWSKVAACAEFIGIPALQPISSLRHQGLGTPSKTFLCQSSGSIHRGTFRTPEKKNAPDVFFDNLFEKGRTGRGLATRTVSMTLRMDNHGWNYSTPRAPDLMFSGVDASSWWTNCIGSSGGGWNQNKMNIFTETGPCRVRSWRYMWTTGTEGKNLLWSTCQDWTTSCFRLPDRRWTQVQWR